MLLWSEHSLHGSPLFSTGLASGRPAAGEARPPRRGGEREREREPGRTGPSPPANGPRARLRATTTPVRHCPLPRPPPPTFHPPPPPLRPPSAAPATPGQPPGAGGCIEAEADREPGPLPAGAEFEFPALGCEARGRPIAVAAGPSSWRPACLLVRECRRVRAGGLTRGERAASGPRRGSSRRRPAVPSGQWRRPSSSGSSGMGSVVLACKCRA